MQSSFSELEYAAKGRQTRRDRFLAEIEAITPWTELQAAIEAHYPSGQGRGRPPIGLARMLRMYVAQQCFGLSDEGIEDAIYDSQATTGTQYCHRGHIDQFADSHGLNRANGEIPDQPHANPPARQQRAGLAGKSAPVMHRLQPVHRRRYPLHPGLQLQCQVQRVVA